MNKYKKKSGYQLKKTETGKMRWHKIVKSSVDEIRSSQRMTVGSAAISSGKYLIDKNKHKRIESIIPGVPQMSFVPPVGSMDLSIPVDKFYDISQRLWLPKRSGAPGDLFFHGTRYLFSEFAQDADDKPMGTGHWNNVLGNHFSENEDTAAKFKAGSVSNGHMMDPRSRWREKRGEGRIIQAVIGSKKPIIVREEADFDQLALAYVINKNWSDEDIEGLRGLIGKNKRDRLISLVSDTGLTERERLKKLTETIGYDFSMSEAYQHIYADSEAYSDDDEDDEGIPSWYQNMISDSQDFKRFLRGKGYDSMIYNNKVEGGIGVSPFDNKQISIAEERPDPRKIITTTGSGSAYRKDYEDHLRESVSLGEAVHSYYAFKGQADGDSLKDKNKLMRSKFSSINRARSILFELNKDGERDTTNHLLDQIMGE